MLFCVENSTHKQQTRSFGLEDGLKWVGLLVYCNTFDATICALQWSGTKNIEQSITLNYWDWVVWPGSVHSVLDICCSGL